jgi:mono/diheme cytochrome c family protein
MKGLRIWLLAASTGLVAASAAALIQASSWPGDRGVVEVRIEGLGPETVDRCPTCHSVDPGSEYPAGHPEVPGYHPVERFGCALCHGGQGRALERDWAHGRGGESLLHLASDGSERRERLEAGCARCHIQSTEAGLVYDPNLVPHVVVGQTLFVERGCWGCHRLADLSQGERGPDLSDVGARLAGDELHLAIADPSASPSSTTMPRLRLPEPELRDLVTFLLAQVDPRREVALATSRRMAARRPGTPPPRPPVNEGMAQGADLMANMGCVGCHRLDMHDGAVGPDLRWEGELRGPTYLQDMITRPAATVPGSRMPPIDLHQSEVEAIKQYLGRQLTPPPADVEVVWERICARCHGLDGLGRTAVAPYLARRPRDLSSPQFFSSVSTERLAESLTNGVPGTPMAPWGKAIPAFGGRRVVSFLAKRFHGGKIYPRTPLEVPERPERLSRAARAAGDHLFEVECSSCHGANGLGDGAEARWMRPRPRDLTNGAFFSALSDERIYRSITHGLPWSRMPSHMAGYSQEVMWAMVRRVRQLAGEPLAGISDEDRWPWQRGRQRKNHGEKRPPATIKASPPIPGRERPPRSR